jgi:hypothetical protein
VLTDDVYYRSFSEQMTTERIEHFLAMRSSYWWLQLCSPFLIVSVKAAYTALCVMVSIIVIGKNTEFSTLFKLALIAESVFALQMAIQVLCGMFLLDVRVPDDYTNFAPLSLLQAFDPTTLALWMKHPLRTINVFEVLYIGVMAWLLTPQLKHYRFGQTVRLVAVSYGLGLLLWVVALAFLLLQIS